jgi:hypothetical protein
MGGHLLEAAVRAFGAMSQAMHLRAVEPSRQRTRQVAAGLGQRDEHRGLGRGAGHRQASPRRWTRIIEK